MEKPKKKKTAVVWLKIWWMENIVAKNIKDWFQSWKYIYGQ